MVDWDDYARRQPHTEAAYAPEPVQVERIRSLPRRCVGTTLDVGCSDGYGTSLIREGSGVLVVALDISPLRAARAADRGLSAVAGSAYFLPFPDASFDTVVLGETLEHLDNPGLALAEAFRVARERVVYSVPLNGWADPTHQWRISLDHFYDEAQHTEDWTKGEQVTMTFARGLCWPPNFYWSDADWRAQFRDGR